MSSNSLTEPREDGTPRPYPLDTDGWRTVRIFASFLDWEQLAVESQGLINDFEARVNELRGAGELDHAILVRFSMQRWLPLDAMIRGIMETYADAYFRSSYSDCKRTIKVASKSESLIV